MKAVLPFFAAAVALSALALFGASHLATGGARVGFLWGGAFSVGAGALSLAALAWGESMESLQALLGAFVAGFFARMIAVGVGFVASKGSGASPLGYVAGFLGLYGVLQLVEIAFVLSQTRARPSRAS